MEWIDNWLDTILIGGLNLLFIVLIVILIDIYKRLANMDAVLAALLVFLKMGKAIENREKPFMEVLPKKKRGRPRKKI